MALVIIIITVITYCWYFPPLLVACSFGLPMEMASNHAKQEIVCFEYCHMPPRAPVETTSLFQKGHVQ